MANTNRTTAASNNRITAAGDNRVWPSLTAAIGNLNFGREVDVTSSDRIAVVTAAGRTT